MTWDVAILQTSRHVHELCITTLCNHSISLFLLMHQKMTYVAPCMQSLSCQRPPPFINTVHLFVMISCPQRPAAAVGFLTFYPLLACRTLVRLGSARLDQLRFESHIFSIHPFTPPIFFFYFLSCFSHCIVKSSLSPSGIPLFPSSPSCSPASLPLQSESCRRGLRRSVCLASGLSCYRGLNAMETKFLLHNAGMQVCERGRACTRRAVVKYGHIPVGLG